MGFRISKGDIKFNHVLLSFGLKIKNKTFKLFMISPYQKLLPEGNREEKGMRKSNYI